MELPIAHVNLAMEKHFAGPLSNLSNPLLLPLLLLSLMKEKHTPDASIKIKTEYDYIIAGGGTAGSVLAGRLSERSCVSVLLLEAGPRPPTITDVPAIAASLWTTDVAWDILTAPQKHTGAGLINRQVSWRSGKALGGTTIINGGAYVRGNKKDYDAWAAAGAKDWNYKKVLPYFKKAEDNLDRNYVESGYHGTGGPITVTRSEYQPEIKEPIFRAAKELGYKFIDPNGPTQTGFYNMQAHLRGNRRCSTAKAYLVPAENRTNLDILPNALVTKVMISNGSATGVEFIFDGFTYQVRAEKEVIVSAGAIHTPQILMLSGVGPKKELKKFNIPVHADLPVGKNLQDHAGITVNFVLNSTIPEFYDKLADENNINQYMENRTGPLASPAGLSIIALLRDNKIDPKIDHPNYEVYFAEGSIKGLREVLNIKPEVYEKVFGPYLNESVMVCYAHHLHAKSFGTITLRSNKPSDDPIIDPNYLHHPQDVHETVEAMKACIRVGKNHHMSQVVSHIFDTTVPGCEKYDKNDDRYLECSIRSILLTYGHYCGTAKMGYPEDRTTVVDPKLRVKGIKGLRVADASVMPIIPAGNTGAPTIMIGERASDFIKETISCSDDN